MKKQYPEMSNFAPKVEVMTPDETDRLPPNAIEIYFDYGCKTQKPVSILAVELMDRNDDQCTFDYVWDTGNDNAPVMCNWPDSGM